MKKRPVFPFKKQASSTVELKPKQTVKGAKIVKTRERAAAGHTFTQISDAAHLLKIFHKDIDEVLFYYEDPGYDELSKTRLQKFFTEVSSICIPNTVVPKDGDMDGVKTSDSVLIGLAAKHKLIGSQSKGGYSVFLYPKEASLGIDVRELDDFGTDYEPAFSCCEFIWNVMSARHPTCDLLQEAQRLKCEHKKHYLYLRLLLQNPKHPLIIQAHEFNKGFYEALSPTFLHGLHQCEHCLVDEH